jgi:hypothetical protein
MNEPVALQIEFLPSRIAAAVTLAVVVATAALIAWFPVDAWERLLAVTALGIYGLATVRQWARRATRHAIVGLTLGADRRIAIIERGGRRIDGEVQHDSYVGSALTTIVWRGDGRRRSRAIAILPDMLPAEDFRKLRVLLRFGKVPPARE